MDKEQELAELEELDRLESEKSASGVHAATAAPPGNKAPLTRLEQENAVRADQQRDNAHWADKGSRFLQGAESLVTGAAQLGAHAGTELNRRVVAPIADALGATNVARRARDNASVVADSLDAEIQQRALDRRKKQDATGNQGMDIAGGAGQVAGAMATGGASVAANPAATLLRRTLSGGGTGAVVGAGGTEVEDGSNGFWKKKGLQTAAGTVVGAGIPLAGAALPTVATAAAKTGDTVLNTVTAPARLLRNAIGIAAKTKGAVERIKTDYYRRLVGEENVPGLVDTLRHTDDVVPGGKATVAEAVSNDPFGSPLKAQQSAVAQTHGGVSGKFDARIRAQEIARESARREMRDVTDPMRAEALGNATNVNHAALNQEIAGIAASPNSAVSTTRAMLSTTAKDIADAKSPQELYAIRKRINDQLSSKLESDQAAVAGSTVELRAMKASIDKAIEEGGGGDSWRKYLAEYSKRAQALQQSEERAAEQYKPRQTTAVGGAGDASESALPALPNLLSRKVMLINAIGRGVEGHIKPSVDASMAEDFLDPTRMADILEKAGRPKGQFLEQTLRKIRGMDGAPPSRLEPVTPRAPGNFALQPSPGKAYEPGHQPQLLRSHETLGFDHGFPLAESSRIPQDTVNLKPPPGTAFEPNQNKLDLPKPKYSYAEFVTLLKKLRAQE